MTATARGRRAMMGDVMRMRKGDAVSFAVHAEGVSGGAIGLVEDGKPYDKPITADKRTFSLVSDGKRHWLRAEVRDAGNHLLLIGNPIYLNF
jgi:hypothetical protein